MISMFSEQMEQILEHRDEKSYKLVHKPQHKLQPRTYEIVWRNVLIYIYLHASSLYGLYLIFTEANYKTTLFGFLLLNLGNLGITGGVHRLWSHRTYKARMPLKVFLLVLNTMAFQDSVITWCRDHRLHHKYSDTDADPHNPSRGFFYAHVGWLLTRKHPDVRTKGKNLDMSDLMEDPMLRFQHKYYVPLMILLCFVIPTAVPMYFWNEGFTSAYFVNALRYCCGLNVTWLVNSAAHTYGQRPYDKWMNPAENRMVSFFALGEGWHNYHHVFPWDYKTAEFGNRLNATALFIDLMAKLGLAYDLRSASPDMIRLRMQRTG